MHGEFLKVKCMIPLEYEVYNIVSYLKPTYHRINSNSPVAYNTLHAWPLPTSLMSSLTVSPSSLPPLKAHRLSPLTSEYTKLWSASRPLCGCSSSAWLASLGSVALSPERYLHLLLLMLLYHFLKDTWFYCILGIFFLIFFLKLDVLVYSWEQVSMYCTWLFIPVAQKRVWHFIST